MRPISAQDIATAREPWVWDLGNQVLYDLCANNHRHTEDGIIIAKTWLIGRSYAASIERRRNVDFVGGDFYVDVVAPRIRLSQIDDWLDSIVDGHPPGSDETIVAHKMLTDLFESFTSLEKRSLASKYLHFHKPNAFFIYDSRAMQAITKVVPRLSKIPDLGARHFDRPYKDFVRRCNWLCEHVREMHGELMTPREIDKLLLAITDRELRVAKTAV